MRDTKSYVEKKEDIDKKIAEYEARKVNLQEKEAEYYPKAGDFIFKALGASNLKEVRSNWNSRVPEDLKIDKIECAVVEPKLDTTLLMTDPKKFEKQVAAYKEAVSAQKAAVGEVISTLLHVSLQGDLKDALTELGILEGTKKEEVETEEVDIFEEETGTVDEYEYEVSSESDSASYDPYA